MLTSALNGDIAASLPGVLKHSTIYGNEHNKRELTLQLDETLNLLARYVFDAARRGLNVQEALERATEIVGVVPPLDFSGLYLEADKSDDMPF